MFIRRLRLKKVQVFTDNENASRIVSAGSTKQHHSLVLGIFQLCLVDIKIDVLWIPCNANVTAIV